MRPKKKDTEYITADSVYDIIGKKLKMHPETVRDVFQVYAELHLFATQNQKRLALGTIGQFTFDIRKGRKAGTEYNIFEVDKENPSLDCNGRPARKAIRAILEKDEPNYIRSVFEVFPARQKRIKEATKDNRYQLPDY